MRPEAVGENLGTSTGRLLTVAAAALASRRELDAQIALLVEEPLDPDGPARIRTAQERASAAWQALAEARSLHGTPPWADPDCSIQAPLVGGSS